MSAVLEEVRWPTHQLQPLVSITAAITHCASDVPQHKPTIKTQHHHRRLTSNMFRENHIFNPSEDTPYALRTIMELHTLQGIGAILDKRQWWVKWQQCPEVREKWLQEVEREFVERTLAETMGCWPRFDDREQLKSKCVAAVELVDDEATRAALSEICSEVFYSETWKGGDDDEDEEDEDEEEGDEESGSGDKEQNEEEGLRDEESQRFREAGERILAQFGRDGHEEGAGYGDEDDAADEETEQHEVDDYEARMARMTRFYGSLDPDYVAVKALLEKANADKLEPLRRLNPYGQVGWYMHQWSRLRRVRALLARGGDQRITLNDVFGVFACDTADVSWDALADRVLGHMNQSEADEFAQTLRQKLRREYAKEAADVVLALRFDGGLSVAALFNALGNESETRDDVLHSLLQYVAMIHVELDAVRKYTIEALDAAVEKSNFTPEATAQGANPRRVTWGPVEELFLSDFTVSVELKNKLLRGVMKLEDVPEDQRDWHPRTNGQVLDLIHPSLYCGVFKHTKVLDISLNPEEDVTAHLHRLLARRGEMRELTNPFKALSVYERVEEKQIKFQWLPSEFDVDASGAVKIRSYINNLHPEDHRDLYESIEEVFSSMEPLFNRTLSCLAGAAPDERFQDAYLDRKNMNELPLRPCVPTQGSVFCPQGEFDVRGKRLQVIVKIAEIVLTPENPQYNGGSWHVEGTAVEGIVATGIYYFCNDNLTDSKLAFRVAVTEPDYEQDDRMGVQSLFGLVSDQALTQDIGAVTTTEDRCIVFPNTLQHKVLPFELMDKTKPGVRKLLCFFVVDPSKPIVSTATVPPQQHDWIKRAQREAFQQTTMGSVLPEPMQSTVMSMTQEGMSLEQAHAFRLELMDERSPEKTTENEDWLFSLCEH